MADKRKFFRARRLACGGRSLPRLCLLAASLAVVLAAGPVHAQDAGLKSGAASLAAGKYDAAVRQLSAAINAGTASPGDAAKALYLRGIAYRKMGEPARAAADLGAAIWLGLPEADRVKALVNRGLAFKAAGLSKESEAEFASARKVGGSREVDQLIADGGGTPEGAAAIAAFSTEVRPEGQPSAPAKPRSSWLPSFGRGDAGDAAPAPQPEPTPTRTASASPQASAPTSKPATPARRAPGAPPSRANSSKSSSSGGNRLTRWFGSRTDSSPARGTHARGASARARRRNRSRVTSAKQASVRASRRSRQFELVHDHREPGCILGRRRKRKQEKLAHLRAHRGSRPSRTTCGDELGGRRLPSAACHQPLRGRGEGVVEKGIAEPRSWRRVPRNRESRYRQFRHVLQPQDRPLPGQGAKP